MADTIQKLIEHVKNAYNDAENNKSKISEEIIKLKGMSGTKTRHFYNNLLNMDDVRYLEIGVWKGSTFCAAIYNNNVDAICIDNWSEFAGPKKEFETNLNKYKKNNKVKFIESDCFTTNVTNIPKRNIYMYDGRHTEEDQYRALTHFYNCLDDIFVYIVDDWNWKIVRDGTKRAIKDLNLKILFEKEIRFTGDECTTLQTQCTSHADTWWNGIYFAVFQK